LLFKLVVIVRKYPGFRVEIVLILKLCPHFIQVHKKEIFSSQLGGVGKVVYFLIGSEPIYKLFSNIGIGPYDIDELFMI
jgi:hypothetical protein